ncbi:aspartate/glutamate racemase family protein [Bacillaceae bacterium S4-13-58]
MKTIGLIGGMSWESTAEYYRVINERVKEELGGLHSAKCILYSVNFEEIERYQHQGDWVKAGEVLGDVALSLEKAGADFIALCTNTMHKVIGEIESRVSIPILHIADTTAKQIQRSNLKTVGLLGTKYTMEQDFLKSRIQKQGIDVIIPNQVDMERINQVIFSELCLGKIESSSKDYYLEVVEELASRGAQGIILGCTEIGLLIKPQDTEVPLFDTAMIHAIEIVEKALVKE